MKLPLADLEDVAARVDATGLRGKTLLITGGTGFIGRWLLETFCFLDTGARMYVTSRDIDAFRAKAPHLTGHPAITMVSEPPASFDLVIHGATPPSEALATGGPSLFFETIEATHRLLDASVRAGAQRFLYLSSGAVYGAASAYGETKHVGELLCSMYSKQLHTIVARGFAFIGPHIPLSGKFAAGNFLKNALDGTPIEVLGDGTPLRSYLYMSDLAVWLWTLLLRGDGLYDVGSEDEVSIEELAHEAAKLSGVPVTIHGVAQPGRAPERYVPSTARARNELGLQATVDWRTALRKTYDWYRESA
jgi:dTDP-glucose 4,6-dehydratase